MNATEFTALLVLSTAMSFTPGPNTTLSTALAANHGLKRALPFVCSVPIGFGALLGVCALGLGALLLALPLLGWVVKIVGVAYLLWLAWKLIQATGLASANAAQMNVGFWQGASLQFMNIKGWMLALAIMGGWIAGRDHPGARFAIVLPVLLVFTFASTLSYALMGSLLRDWLAGPAQTGRRLRWFNRAMAAVLVLTAGWMLTV
ncbi:LysE family translocator [Rhodoferax sediminis]|jgi:threonine/homoserine/homoserine lactone efflux protein|uniref:LysE family translocator n=1 Tax=Rhodoferax sediminis TaxID=2509614 RepID=A0A515D6X9_9BURK|nr:LysE family translocator [Rhodoferax sediminis]QDL36173.1 LysE family translocator [Rhodoferax sediminis]